MKQNNTISYPAIGNHRKVGNPMELNERYAEIIERYPEYVTQKQMIEICGICAKTAYNLERRGVIPYTVEVTPTGRIHRIKLLDVIAYLHQKGNLYCEDQRVNDDLYQFFKSEMENLPDLMRTKQIRSFTGFSTTAIQRWVLEKRLTALPGRKGWNIPKDAVASFLSCAYCIRGNRKPPQYRALLDKFESISTVS